MYLVRGKRSGWIVLHIVVSIKQVPDTKIIKMNPKTNTMDRASAPAILNPYDTHAVQEAVRLKEQYGGIVSVVSMGPPQAVKAIQKCLEIGADEGYLISDRAFAGADTLATSYALTQAIKKINKIKPVDLVLTGKMSIDGDTGQVGPGIARRLDIPQLTSVQKIQEVNPKDGYIVIERKIEDGYEVVQSKLPSLLAVEKDINEVPYSTLPNMIRAARYTPNIWAVKDLEDVDVKLLGMKGSPTIVAKVWAPSKSEGAVKFEGDQNSQVSQLMKVLSTKKEVFMK